MLKPNICILKCCVHRIFKKFSWINTIGCWVLGSAEAKLLLNEILSPGGDVRLCIQHFEQFESMEN